MDWGGGARVFAVTRCLRALSESAARATRVAPPNPVAASLTTFAGAPHRAMFREGMSCALGAASALVVPGRCRVPARVLQHHALLGAMLSQRSLARVALRDKQFLGSERLQLLCCGSPLSALLSRLVAVVDRSGRSSAEHRYIVCTVKRYFSGVAHRLWPERR